MSVWKIVGLAGLAAVAVGASAVAVKVQRDRRAYADVDPNEVRERLRARFNEPAQGDAR